MPKDRVLAVRFSPRSDDDLYDYLLPFKDKKEDGGQSGEMKRLLRIALEAQRKGVNKRE